MKKYKLKIEDGNYIVGLCYKGKFIETKEIKSKKLAEEYQNFLLKEKNIKSIIEEGEENDNKSKKRNNI